MFVSVLLMVTSVNAVHIWDKHYLTWSQENGPNDSSIEDAVRMWNVNPPLELVRVDPGKGDIQISFLPLNPNLLGRAFPPNHPDRGKILINQDIPKKHLFYVIQHEMGHSLGLEHDSDSVMESVFDPNLLRNVSRVDREKIFKLYNCSFDSVTLLNYQTYLLFQGSSYKRLDFPFRDSSDDTLWLPSIKRVDAMYRNVSGHYIIISNDAFYEFDSLLRWVGRGTLNTLFPDVNRVDAVLTFRNGSTFAIADQYVFDGVRKRELRFVFRPFVTNSPIKGAYEELNGNIVLVDDTHHWIYDKTFRFLRGESLCKIKIHCCT